MSFYRKIFIGLFVSSLVLATNYSLSIASQPELLISSGVDGVEGIE